MKTLVGINNLTAIDQLAYANHIQFFYRLGKEFPNDYFALCNPRRMTIDRMRNFCAKTALEHEFDWLMFIDDDVLVPFDCFKKLIVHDKDICAGVTNIRGYPFHPMIFNFQDKLNHYYDDYKDHVENGLVQCDAVGFSCCLIKVDLLKRMRPPFFITGAAHTEDVFFCVHAKEQVKDVGIFVDPSIECAHILGSDIIEPKAVEFWKTLEESRFPSLLASESIMNDSTIQQDRSEEYLKGILG